MRRLLCVPCGQDYKLHPMDEVDGFKLRKVQGLARKPVVHERTTTTFDGGRQVMRVVEEIPSLLCDQCGEKIADGAPAIAVTMWRGQEIGHWESEYFAPPAVAHLP